MKNIPELDNIKLELLLDNNNIVSLLQLMKMSSSNSSSNHYNVFLTKILDIEALILFIHKHKHIRKSEESAVLNADILMNELGDSRLSLTSIGRLIGASILNNELNLKKTVVTELYAFCVNDVFNDSRIRDFYAYNIDLVSVYTTAEKNNTLNYPYKKQIVSGRDQLNNMINYCDKEGIYVDPLLKHIGNIPLLKYYEMHLNMIIGLFSAEKHLTLVDYYYTDDIMPTTDSLLQDNIISEHVKVTNKPNKNNKYIKINGEDYFTDLIETMIEIPIDDFLYNIMVEKKLFFDEKNE